MRKTIATAVGLAVFVIPCGGRANVLRQRDGSVAIANPASPSGAVVSLESALAAAMLKNDAAALEALLAHDFAHIGPSGETIGRDEMLADVKSGALTYDVIERGTAAMRVIGAAVVVTERDLLKGTYRHHYFSGRYRVMRVWGREDGTWRLIASQATFFVEPRENDDEGSGAGASR